MNEEIKNTLTMTYYGQKAQVGRTNFTPGKVDGRPGDMNWPTDMAVPVAGWPAGTDWTFQRTALLGRGTISDSKTNGNIITGEAQNDRKDWIDSI